MNRLIPILMLFSVFLLAREELSSVQKYPASHYIEQTKNIHDVALERRLEFER